MLPLMVCGCGMGSALSTTVREDGSGTVGVRLAVDRELQDYLSWAAGGLGGLGGLGSFLEDLEGRLPENADVLFSLVLGAIPADWAVDQGTDDNGDRWISLSNRFRNLDELQELAGGRVFSLFIDPERFSVEQDRGFFRARTVFSMTPDLDGALEAARLEAADLPMEILGRFLTLENLVTLPGVIQDHNADRVQGSTLIWDVEVTGGRDMYGESVVYDWAHIGLVIFAGLIALVIVILMCIWLIRRHRRSRRAAPPPPPLLVP